MFENTFNLAQPICIKRGEFCWTLSNSRTNHSFMIVYSLILPFREISLWPELSSQPYFRTKGASSKPDEWRTKNKQTETWHFLKKKKHLKMAPQTPFVIQNIFFLNTLPSRVIKNHFLDDPLFPPLTRDIICEQPWGAVDIKKSWMDDLDVSKSCEK